jgi:DNA-binding transcriptional regulator YiaG
MMESLQASSAQGLVIAPKAALAEAENVFTQIGASVETAPLEAVHKMEARAGSGKTYLFLAFYVTRAFHRDQFSETLRKVRQFRNAHFLFYVAHSGVDLAFRVGKTVGHELGETAEVASTVREVKQLLRSWDAQVADPPYSRWGKDLLDARKRLGLTQEQMAFALNVTTRTLQNWERGLGTSQMERKTRDLWELLELMDDYVVAREEKDWLNTPNSAFKDKRPVDLIATGKIRDLIVEFQRLREGQPLSALPSRNRRLFNE